MPRFCPAHEVEKKNDKFLIFKGSFLAKISNLKKNGEKTQLMKKVSTWIDDNFDKLYKDGADLSLLMQKSG